MISAAAKRAAQASLQKLKEAFKFALEKIPTEDELAAIERFVYRHKLEDADHALAQGWLKRVRAEPPK